MPGYIYGLNNTGLEDISEGRFPRYQRWRLETSAPVTQGSFLVALSPRRGQVRAAEGAVLLPDGGGIQLGPGTRKAQGMECTCECLMWDETTHRITAIGLRSVRDGGSLMLFTIPVDLEYNTLTGEGIVYAQGAVRCEEERGFALGPWVPVGDEAWKTHNGMRASFTRIRRENIEG